MSNVLIGIIGVILFIGLALAGALILGSDFQEASSESRAAAMMSSNQQVSQAVAMHNIKTSSVHQSSSALTSLAPRFLKVVPTNPVETAAAYAVKPMTNVGTQSGNTDVIVMTMTNTARNQDICLSIGRNTGFASQTATSVPTSATMPTAQAGCFRPSAAIGSLPTNQLVVFQRV